MSTRSRILLAMTISACLPTAGRLAAQQASAKHEQNHSDHGKQSPQVENDLISSMTPGHAHHGAHLKLTEPQPPSAEDQARAAALVRTLREALEKYKDYRVAIADSITTREACAEAGGRFVPQLFGWMLHVYPWEKSPEKIWGH